MTDVTAAFRSLRSSRTFTLAALLVLTIAIGAGTALFSVVDAVVLRGLPFDEHDRPVAVLEHDTRRPETFGAAGRRLRRTWIGGGCRSRSRPSRRGVPGASLEMVSRSVGLANGTTVRLDLPPDLTAMAPLLGLAVIVSNLADFP